MPSGCGEQNMIRLAPNIHILRYLETVNTPNSEELKKKALNHIQKGYQRQLRYRHPDGSYSAFGPKQNLGEDEEGSIWLTAFVISSLGQASHIITVDNKTLQESLNWVVSKQMENGCFPMIGEVFQKELKGGLRDSESSTALTAYIVASLYKSGLLLPTSVSLNAEFCLSAEKANIDIYSLALITYAFTLINSTSYKTQNNLKKLIQLAKHEEDVIWWEKPGGSLALNIEITGYAIMSLLKVGGSHNIITAQAAVHWISTKRNNNGGFVSTQDTIIGLEALTTFAAIIPVTSRPSLLVNVTEISNNQLFPNTLAIDHTNNGLQQRITVKNIPSILLVNTRGEGCALVQATLKYNVDEKIKGDGFELSVSTVPVSQIDECYFQNMEICVRYTLPDLASNMVIIVINLATEYIPDRSSLQQMTGIELWEEDLDENKVILYLNKIEYMPKCLNFIIQKAHNIVNPAPAIITVTDYYHPERYNSVNHTISCNNVPKLYDSNNDDDL